VSQINIYLALKEEYANIYISLKILSDVHMQWNTQTWIRRIIWVQLNVNIRVTWFWTLGNRATLNTTASELVKEDKIPYLKELKLDPILRTVYPV